MLPDLDGSGDAAIDGGAPDGGVDAALDAEAMRPDAGVTFRPSHIAPVYSLTAPNVVIMTDAVVDTFAQTIKVGTAAPTVLTNMVVSNNVAVWSVGSFFIQNGSRLTVTGSRPLVVVAATTVDIAGHIDASGSDATPGPGGFAAASGTAKGADGVKPGSSDASGGGGAGNATAGGNGGTRSSATGGAGGPVDNATGALLVGGSGGGNGGGFPAAKCTDPTRGRGGVGGGAIQFSAVGMLTITGSIDLGGGGGSGGCEDDPSSDDYRGGGGGGAAGVAFFESATGILFDVNAEIAAVGGGGGEGGESGNMGVDGDPGPFPADVASGGTGSGGNGGNGGSGTGKAATAPTKGASGDSAGGGGGSGGRVFFGTRTPAELTVSGSIAALRSDFPF